jgi:nucleotide-binding universal stress UspA family protein
MLRRRSDVALEVITGNGWDEALESVFLGSHGAKIIRHGPVPVQVLPG